MFKSLRNAVALSSTNQNLICHEVELVQNTYDIVENYILSEEPMNKAITEMWMQFLCNIVVNNLETGKKIWHTFFDYRSRYALHMNADYQYYTCALLYNILKSRDMDDTTQEEIFSMFSSMLFSKVDTNGNEYMDLLIEYYLTSEILMVRYAQVKPNEIRILTTLRKILWSDCDKDKEVCSKRFLEMLIKHFNQDSGFILRTVADCVDKIEPYKVSVTSDILAAISCYERYLPVLQENKSLLINCIFILRSMHDLGKDGTNSFTPIQKLAEFTGEDGIVYDHPAFGFKANMIRIIGNMCWREKDFQEEMRELHGIPLILDCCNMDARNPFIIQWVVLAIRNICEGNLKNQAVIAQMNRQGVVSPQVLTDMGITLHDDGSDRIKIVPVDVNTLAVNKSLNSLNLGRGGDKK